MNLCVCDREECKGERGVDTGVNVTKLFETIQVVGIVETDRKTIGLWKKPMNLCS
jgi:hypothetical protein